MDIWSELAAEGIDKALIDEIRNFRAAHPAPEAAAERIPAPRFMYYGREVWESAAAAILCGEHLLLAGPKATGKNVLAENLAAAFGRPCWNVSMYINIDAASLIGADTLKDGRVEFREGPVCRCARWAGSCGARKTTESFSSCCRTQIRTTMKSFRARGCCPAACTAGAGRFLRRKIPFSRAKIVSLQFLRPEIS